MHLGTHRRMQTVGSRPLAGGVIKQHLKLPAMDGILRPLVARLEAAREGDAMIVVTAGSLKATSPLRKLIEKHPQSAAIAIYHDPPSRAEIEAELARAGLKDIGEEAMGALNGLARSLDPGDFRQVLEKVALYKLGDPAPLTVEEVDLCAPATIGPDLA